MVQLCIDMICRVCARSGCTPLSDEINGSDIMSTIRSLTNISIEVDDPLPKYICTNCLKSLQFAWNFKRKCEASDKQFREILNPAVIQHQIKLQKGTKQEEKLAKQQIKTESMLHKKSPKMKQFKCSPCDLTFPSKEKLMSHHGVRKCKRRACDICGQLVLSIAQHMQHTHKQSAPYKCTTCGKEFPVIARLRNHMLIHTNTFNFFCDLCPYKCKQKHYLVLHMRTHTGEKPFKCAQCNATFVNQSNLNKHKLTHQAEKFKCVQCEKTCRTSTALREHQEAIHMNIKHTCNYCEREFRYKSDVRKHERRRHNRVKRENIGAEPTYKQLEKLQKVKDQQMTIKETRARRAVMMRQQ